MTVEISQLAPIASQYSGLSGKVKLGIKVIVFIALDILSMIYAGLQTVYVYFDWTRKSFDYYGVNPETLPSSAKKTNDVAIVCLNGLYGSQADFLPLLSILSSMKHPLPIFTGTIKHDGSEMEQLDQVLERVSKVFKKADRTGKLILLGHSKGVHLALRKALMKEGASHENIEYRSVISLAGRIRMTEESETQHPLRFMYSDIVDQMKALDVRVKALATDEEAGPCIDFRTLAGSLDWIFGPDSVLRDPSQGDTEYQCTIPWRGHVGILFSARAGSVVKEWVEDIRKHA